MKISTMIRTALGAALLVATGANAASAQDNQYIGQIKAFGFGFCPTGWIETNGQSLSLQQYGSLYAQIGFLYGGTNSTFNVPDLRGRVVVGAGQGPGLANRIQGATFGQSDVTMSEAQMPRHNHHFAATSTRADSPDPAGRTLGSFFSVPAYARASSNVVAMHEGSIETVGQSKPFSVQDPVLVVTQCIATVGLFPEP